MFSAVLDVVGQAAIHVGNSLRHNWPYLLASVLIAAMVSIYVGTDRLAVWLRRKRWMAITGAVLLATFTPFCSCGTTALVLGMLATKTPWAPIVAFMVASPLTSPSELLLSAGLFGWSFALTYFVGATGLGFVAGGVAGLLEDRGLLVGQARMRATDTDGQTGGCAGGCGGSMPESATDSVPAEPSAGCGVTCGQPGTQTLAPSLSWVERLRLRSLVAEVWTVGRRLVLYYVAFSGVVYVVLELVPSDTLLRLLGGDSAWSVPLAALLGIPIYITSEGSLPMIAALMSGGLGSGAAMAFLITGAGTSLPAISGMLLIARQRVVSLVVASLLVGAIVVGWFTAAVLT